MEVAEIWRYPVKSMRGEQLESAQAGPGGIDGDRGWAVVDRDSGVSLSAKRYPALLQCRAWSSEQGVQVELPDGSRHAAGSDEVSKRLSALLDRSVTMRAAVDANNIRHEFPEGITDGKGDAFLYPSTLDAFFDSTTLQLLTTGTLQALQRLLPDAVISAARFRPNFLVRTDTADFAENDWVGRDIRLGALSCHAYEPTNRCIMVTMEQEQLPRDTRVIRTVLKSNDGRAGVALRTGETETVHTGDAVTVL